jgi:hypothetical protein
MPKPLRIKTLNDLLRVTFMSGRVVLTDGITSQDTKTIDEIIQSVRGYADFDEESDPYGEHDFGAFDHPVAGKIFWKIDYYDEAYEGHSPDPADPGVTKRVLTIFLADEY